MAKSLKAGDKVAWRSSGGGSIRPRRAQAGPCLAKIKDHEIAASADNPEFLVRSEKSGKVAAHKPAALKEGQMNPGLIPPADVAAAERASNCAKSFPRRNFGWGSSRKTTRGASRCVAARRYRDERLFWPARGRQGVKEP